MIILTEEIKTVEMNVLKTEYGTIYVRLGNSKEFVAVYYDNNPPEGCVICNMCGEILPIDTDDHQCGFEFIDEDQLIESVMEIYDDKDNEIGLVINNNVIIGLDVEGGV